MYDDEIDRVGPYIDLRTFRERVHEKLTPQERVILSECPEPPMTAEALRMWGIEEFLD